MVRVFNSQNNCRALIRGMSKEVLDLQFAHLKSSILLGCIEQSALHVHKFENFPDKILSTFIVKIEDPITGHIPLYDKIRWCPFVPEVEDEVDEYIGQQVVWSRGNVYQCYSIKLVVDRHGVCLKNQSKWAKYLTVLSIADWKTPYKCNRRKSETKGNFNHNRRDFFS